MARRPFGGTAAAIVTDPYSGAVRPGAQGTLWTTPAGGTRITDVTDPAGIALPSGIVTADANGRIAFLGPVDGTDELYADFGFGRYLLEAIDLDDRVAAVETTVAGVDTRLAAATGRLTTLEGSRAQPGGLATLGPDGRVPYPQLPPMPVGAATLDELTDVVAPTAVKGQALVYDGTTWRPGSPGPYVTVANTPTPFFLAASGGGNIYPINTLEAAAAHAAAGVALDVTCNVTADGIAAAIRDTADATTTLTGPVTSLYANALLRQVVDAGAWFGGGWGNLAVPMLADVLAVAGGRTLVTIECQTAAGVRAATDIVKRMRLTDSVIIQTFTLADLAYAAAAGIPCMLLHANGSGLVPATLIAAGIRWIGTSATAATPANVAALIAGGLKVVLYTVNRHVDRDPWIPRGVHGFFSDDPYYLNTDPTRYRLKADPFKGLTYPHGFQWAARAGSAANRGTFSAPGWWTMATNSWGFMLQGWACPLAQVNGSSISTDVRYDVLGADATQYGGLFFGAPTDAPFNDTAGVATSSGYTAILRQNGQLALFKYAAGVVTAGPTVNTPAITASTIATLKVDITASGLTLTRVGVTAPNSVTWADTTNRGPYLHLGGNMTSGQISFRNVQISP